MVKYAFVQKKLHNNKKRMMTKQEVITFVQVEANDLIVLKKWSSKKKIMMK